MLLKANQLKAIFFDFDNVLLYSELTHYHAWLSVLEQFHCDSTPIKYETLIGLNDMAVARMFVNQFKLEVTAQLLWDLKYKAYFEMIKTGLGSPEGRDTFLERISQQYITGIVSSSSQSAISESLKQENIAHYFDFVISHEDCERHKPDPMPYQKALAIASVAPDEALVIEDSVAGITAAQNASIAVLGILKDQAPHQIIKDIPYFNDFNEIGVFLKGSGFKFD